jgi:D-alanyl-lipoteichoic acid acyltransferase DltB (MBOAT superfamily)
MEIPILYNPIIFFFLLLVYFHLPNRLRWFFLLFVSFIYYLVINLDNLFAVILIIGSILIDYFLAKRIPESSKPRLILFASILLNIGVLSIYKFPTFFSPIIDHLPTILPPLFRFNVSVMPVGLSFYTFAKLGYIIDIYQKTAEPEQHLGHFATFVSFFPNIVSGPIEKGNHFLSQLGQKVDFDEKRIVEGLQRILWGLFKKIVIANRLAVYVNYVYEDPQSADGKCFWSQPSSSPFKSMPISQATQI